MLTHKQLRYFVDIIDAGSFSLAAERLFIAQSALSRQVREMEKSLDVVLLERDARRLVLTPAGRSLYTDAQRILAALAHAELHARHAQQGTEGVLRLLHSSSVPLVGVLLEMLRQHAGQYPGVVIDISQAASEQQARDVEQGQADVGLARMPVLRRYPQVCYRALYREPLVAIFPAGHVLAGRASVAMLDLRDEAFVALPHLERGGLSHKVAELCRAHGFQPRGAVVRSRKWSQLALVQAGLGLSIVPLSMAQLAPQGVSTVPLQGQGEDYESTVMALWREDAPVLVQRFVDTLPNNLGSA